MSLPIVDELRQWLRVKDASTDGDLQIALDAAIEAAETFCGVQFDDAADDASPRVFAARWRDLLYVDPISADDDFALAIDTSGDGTFNQAWSASDWQLEPLNQRRAGMADHPYTRIRATGAKTFPVSAEARVQVTARWGWSTTPRKIRQAVLLHASRLHSRRNTAAGIATGEALPTRVAMGLDNDVQALLIPFQRQDLWT